MSNPIVILSSQDTAGRHNDIVHRGFFDSCPLPIVWYGEGEQNYKKEVPIWDAISEHKPCLVCVNMKKRVHWATAEQIAKIKCPKCIVEVDNCYEETDEWYRASAFDHIFFRHFADWRMSRLNNSSWLPFSAGQDWLFDPIKSPHREWRITFCGSVVTGHYSVRETAIRILTSEGLLDPNGVEYKVGMVQNMEYLKWIRRAELLLNCSSQFRLDNPKHIIAPACGTLCMTDGSAGISELFPDKDCCFFYRENGFGLVKSVTALLEDHSQLLERRAKAFSRVATHHMHHHRWAEIFSIFNIKP